MRAHSGLRSGFSLSELLVVVMIIATLSAFLLPTMQLMRGRAGTVSCLSYLRHANTAILGHAAEDRGLLPKVEYPDGDHWFNRILDKLDFAERGSNYDFAGRSERLRCPVRLPADDWHDAGERDWLAYNINLGTSGNMTLISSQPAVRLLRVPRPALTVSMMDGWAVRGTGPKRRDQTSVFAWVSHDQRDPRSFLPGQSDKHRGSANYAWLDGHVETVRESEMIRQGDIWGQGQVSMYMQPTLAPYWLW